jgi:hypothetical protein
MQVKKPEVKPPLKPEVPARKPFVSRQAESSSVVADAAPSEPEAKRIKIEVPGF